MIRPSRWVTGLLALPLLAQVSDRPIYHGYPVYDPRKEPPNYMQWLAAQAPELAFDSSQLKSDSDWVLAGESVFNSPDLIGLLTPDDLHNLDAWKKFKFEADAEGALPGWRYVIRKKGLVEAATTLCAICHDRVVDGLTVSGAPATSLIGSLTAYRLRKQWNQAPDYDRAGSEEIARQFSLFSVPAQRPDPAEPARRMLPAQLLAAYDALAGGTVARAGTSLRFAPRIPDLIGVKDRSYLRATGFDRNLGMADLMGYCAREEGIADPNRLSETQLRAVVLYLYSLKPPVNPNRPDKTSKAGQKIFEREGCPGCHPPNSYTTGKLIAAGEIGTDPHLTSETRVATGSYRIPSLKNIWYREPLEHNGAAATLEDWFDPARLREAAGIRPVKGHLFGLKLSFEERRSLMAFLRTL